jgi:predicted dehydrogenase
MRDAARARDALVAVDYQFRFEPGVEALRAAFKSGRIGALQGADFSWITAGRARPEIAWSWQNDADAGGGVIGGFFSHVADLLRWITGHEPAAATACSSVVIPYRSDWRGMRRRVTAEDRLTALLEFDRFAASCSVTNCQLGGGGMRIELRGERGVLVMSQRYPYRSEDCKLTACGEDGAAEPLAIECRGAPDTGDSRAYAVSRCLAAFVSSAQGHGVSGLPGPDEAVAAHCVMHAVRESCRNHGRVPVVAMAARTPVSATI